MMITVFTPTYNRAHLLPRLYESLVNQTSRNFEWVIVDDGSIDNTEEIVGEWRCDFPIKYYYKSNEGKHTAINYGVERAKGELFFIADSDDWLPKDALKIVEEEYKACQQNEVCGGVAGLDRFANGKVTGSGLPFDTIDCDAMDIRYRYRVTGDLKEVFKTRVLREFPFPEIRGEQFCPEQLVWFRIAQKYKLHYFNKPIYVADYQVNGITAGIVKARVNSPIASCMTYGEMLKYDIPFFQKLKAAINYWRFRYCIKSAEGKGGIPSISFVWKLLAPMGYAMHIKDKRIVIDK